MNVEEKVAVKVKEIMELLKIEENESNKDTPRRVAKMWCNEIFENRNKEEPTGEDFKVTVFHTDDNKDPISVTLPFYSTCDHHWLPFFGEIRITYIPYGTIIGLSKLPRVVRFFSRKPQLQEKLTNDIGRYLVKILDPNYLSIRMVAEHTCVSMRGAESPCKTTTVFEYDRKDGVINNSTV